MPFVSTELPFDLTNFQTMTIEILIGIVLGIIFFVLQYRISDKVDKLIQQKAKSERENKRSQCQRIIKSLQEIQDAEQTLKTYLTQYKVGDKTNETLRLLFGMSLRSLADRSIYNMNYAIGQLQILNDDSLRKAFLDYLGAFNVLPNRILKDNMPQEEYQRKGLLSDIDKQTEKFKILSIDSIKNWILVNHYFSNSCIYSLSRLRLALSRFLLWSSTS